MVACRCGSGSLGCIWRHLSWSLPWRCNFFKATFGSFRGWCGAAFLSGFGAGSDGGLPLRKRRPGMHLEASLLVVALAV